MTGPVTGIRRRRTVAGRRETSHLPPDRDFYGQTLNKLQVLTARPGEREVVSFRTQHESQIEVRLPSSVGGWHRDIIR